MLSAQKSLSCCMLTFALAWLVTLIPNANAQPSADPEKLLAEAERRLGSNRGRRRSHFTRKPKSSSPNATTSETPSTRESGRSVGSCRDARWRRYRRSSKISLACRLPNPMNPFGCAASPSRRDGRRFRPDPRG